MKLRKVYLVALTVLALTILAFALTTVQHRDNEFGESASLKTPNQQYEVEVVTSSEGKRRGLSGRESLPQDQGMLFAYNQEGERCFWMKDMNFSLDIIWLNQRRKVVHIEQSLSPDTYPQSFCPDQGAMYVVELNAGEVGRADIKEGDKLDF